MKKGPMKSESSCIMIYRIRIRIRREELDFQVITYPLFHFKISWTPL